MSEKFDFDQVIIGTGFGGSCSALRLSEKGHRVLMLEKGKRWKDTDFADKPWNMKKFLWAPKLGMTGTMQISLTRKITALHGAGVGGGSGVGWESCIWPQPLPVISGARRAARGISPSSCCSCGNVSSPVDSWATGRP